ncbi:hypothetical protein [Aeromonas hydrophila]|uniref:hypothetical protein n=1 Tax=Aeromonas hydrophila TaxID=644 RepID=UPI00111C56E0|nr:hypothetical protein [Aeromonas hydrophila]
MTKIKQDYGQYNSHSKQLVTSLGKALEIVERVEGEIVKKGLRYRKNSSVSALFSSVKKLNVKLETMNDEEYKSTFLRFQNAIQIAQAIETAITEPNSKEAIKRVVTSDMDLYKRHHSQGKDFLWELDLFRRLKLGNVQVRFEEPDLVVYLGEALGDYAIACKKTYSKNSVKTAFHAGLSQLEKHEKPGVIAFNLDEFIPEGTIWQGRDSSSLESQLRGVNTAFLRENEMLFRQADKMACCDGVIVSTSLVSDVLDLEYKISLARSFAVLQTNKGDLPTQRFRKFVEYLDRVITQD